MQIIAMLTMLIDHIGIVYFPGDPVWRMIGRLAFPLYAYGVILGLGRTRSRARYVRRLAIIAAAAQIPYMWMLGGWQVNIVGTFLVVIGVLYVLERSPYVALSVVTVAGAMVLLEGLHFDYGAYGLLLMLIYRYVPKAWTIAAHGVLTAVYVLVMGGSWLQMYSVLATVLLVLGPKLLDWIDRWRPQRWLWLSFYPAHMFVLMVLDMDFVR